MENVFQNTYGPLRVLGHLTNSPAVFQVLVNDVLTFLNRFVFVYLDDILSRSLDEHVTHVCQVLQCLLENQLYAKAKKGKFHVPAVAFLGFVIGFANFHHRFI